MKKNIKYGLILGVIAGIINSIPTFYMGLTWDAHLSVFFFWVVSGFMLATSNLQLPPLPKGVLIPFVCLLPGVFIIGWEDPYSLIPVFILTLCIGYLLSFFYNKLAEQSP